MNKKLAVLLCVAMLMTMFAVPVFAAEPAASVVIDGKAVTFEVAPVNDNGRLLVPLRAIFEQLGAKVDWDQATQTATAVKGDTKVVIAIGSLQPTVNGKAVPLQVAAKIVNGRTLAPLRFVGEAFGTVDWDAATSTATMKPAAAPAPAAPAAPADKAAADKAAADKAAADKAAADKAAADKAAADKAAADKAAAPAAAATPDAVVKAAIAAFAPTTATIDLKGNMDIMGGNKFSAKGTANIAADKKCSSTLDVDLGVGGTNKPSPAFCPFSEIIAGPEADGLAVVKTAKLSEEGSNYVLTVTGAPCPASLQGTLDGASLGSKAPVKFKLTVDYTIKVDKASKKVVSVDVVKAVGTGNVMGMDCKTDVTGSISYK